MARKKLGELLIEAGVLKEADLRNALGEQRRWGGALGRTLVEMRLITEETLISVLARQFGVPTIDVDRLVIPQAILELVPADLAQQMSVLPFAQPMKFLDVAMADPANQGFVDELRIRTQLNIRPYLAGPRSLERAIGRFYNRGFAVHMTGQMNAMAPSANNPLDLELGDGPSPDFGLVHEGIRPFPRPGSTQGESPLRHAEIDALQNRMSELEAMVERDEQVLRKLLSLLVAKGVATRDEILEAIR